MTAHQVGSSARPTTDRHDAFVSRAGEVAFVSMTAAALTVAALVGRAPISAVCGVAALLPAGLVDLRSWRLPDRLVGGAAVALSIAVLAEISFGDRLAGVDASHVALGILGFAGPLLALHLLSPTSMGFGDVKASAVLGASLGLVTPTAALVAAALGSALALAVAFVTRSTSVPFGPPLVLGSAVALSLTTQLVT